MDSTREPPSSVVAEPKPQPDTRATQAQAPPPQPDPDSEARYKRRSAFLGSPRAKWGLILAGLVILIGVFFLWRYLGSYESQGGGQVGGDCDPGEPAVRRHCVKPKRQRKSVRGKGNGAGEIDPA